MITIRRAADRGHANHGWLDSHHSFSFANYYDPKHMGFRGLRVINEDRVAPGRGFGTHPHRDMEIISYVLGGSLEHRDSMGNGSVIRPGEIQRMSAGTGVYHSEYNGSKQAPVHFMQIWIMPERRGIEPSYEQRAYSEDERHNGLRLVVTPDRTEDTVSINADMRLYTGLLDAAQSVDHVVPPGRHAWIQLVRGKLEVEGQVLKTSDGAATSDAGLLTLNALEASELLVFDLA